MYTETNEIKERYDVTSQHRASELCESFGVTDVKQVALIHTSLKETGLESWNNGEKADFARGVNVKEAETTQSA